MKVKNYYYINSDNTVTVSKYLMIAKGAVILEEYDNGEIYVASNKTKVSDQYYVDKFRWYQLQAVEHSYDHHEYRHHLKKHSRDNYVLLYNCRTIM